METALRQRAPTRGPGTVTEFLSSLKTLNRHATVLENLPRRNVIQQFSEAPTAVRDLNTLTRRIETIRHMLEAQNARRPTSLALEQANRYMLKLVREKELLEPSEFTARMGWTRQALSKALKSHRVFFVEQQGTRYYPAFLGDAQYERRRIEGVCKSLGELPGSAKLQFFSTPKGSLGGMTPLEALAAGKYATVKATAEGFAQG